ncbi:MAG: hypothetical protein WBP41_03880, partial [Saprospiraceae bacterium]
ALDNEELFWLTPPSDWWFENTYLLFQFIHPKEHARLRYDLAYLMIFRDRHKVASEIYYEKTQTGFFEFQQAFYSPDKNKIRQYFNL